MMLILKINIIIIIAPCTIHHSKKP